MQVEQHPPQPQDGADPHGGATLEGAAVPRQE